MHARASDLGVIHLNRLALVAFEAFNVNGVDLWIVKLVGVSKDYGMLSEVKF